MPAAMYPVVLTERLGEAGYTALIEMTEDRLEGRLALAVERLERRITEECAAVRVELHASIHSEVGGLRRELDRHHAEQLKWSFLFWLGQTATVTGIVSLMR